MPEPALEDLAAAGSRSAELPRSISRFHWRCTGCAKMLEGGPTTPCLHCGHQASFVNGMLMTAPGLAPAGFPAARREHLSGLERDHFWFAPRHRLVSRLLDRFARAGRSAAIDLGCGGGGFLSELARRFETVVGCDAFPESLAEAAVREPRALIVQADLARIPIGGSELDLAVALDVLEHVDPLPFLREAARLVRPGGILVLTVPAFPSLWSELDEAAGHRVRYRKRALEEELRSTGWDPLHATHYQCLLFPLALFARRSPLAFTRRIERSPPRSIGRLLGAIDSAEVALFFRLQLPFGTSLVSVSRRLA